MDDWSKLPSNSKSKLILSTLITTWLSSIAFHLQPIWLQTLVAIHSQLLLTLSPSFCTPPLEVAVQFDLNLSRGPFLGQVVQLDLLLCTGINQEHAVSFLYHIFTQRPWLMERLIEAMGTALVSNSFSPIPSKISFHTKKIVTYCSQTFTKHKNLVDAWTESVSQEW